MRKYIGLLIMVSVFGIILPTNSVASSEVKFISQKAGQFCKNIEKGKTVLLPSGARLKCGIPTGSARAKWQIVVTKQKAPEPTVPKNGLVPLFAGTYAALQDGFSLLIINFSDIYSWRCTTSVGECSIDEQGRVFVNRFEAGSVVSLKVTTSRSGFFDAFNDIRISPKRPGSSPAMVQGSLKSLPNAATFKVDNYDPSSSWTITSTSGTASIDSDGIVIVSGLTNGEEAFVKLTVSRNGFFDQSSTIKVRAEIAFRALTQRDWQLIAKDPNGAKGQYVTIYGKITQFDVATGLSSFRADVAGIDITSNGYWIGGDNSFLSGDAQILKAFVSGDKFVAKVKILGSYSYTSSANYQITAVDLQVYEIARI
jgi:hypothetical protein